MRFQKYLAIFLSLLLLFQSQSGAIFAEEETRTAQEESLFYQDVSKKLELKLAQLKYRKANFRSNLQNTKENYADVEEALLKLEAEIKVLEENYRQDFEALRAMIESKEKERLEMDALQDALMEKEKAIQEKEAAIQELIVLFQQKELFYKEDDVFFVQIFMQEGSSGEILSQKEKLQQVKEQIEGLLLKLQTEKKQLQEEWVKAKSMQKLYRASLSGYEEKALLSESQLKNKQMLFEELTQEKALLAANVDGAKDNEKALEQEIAIYTKNISNLQNHIEGRNKKLSAEELALLEEIERELQGISSDVLLSDKGFVSPLEKGISHAGNPESLLEITATFIDSHYQKLFGVQHYALDIRALQGTPILSVADGIVEDVIFDPESTKYAFVKIAHPGKVMTVYGHISEPFVHVGQFVRSGEPIALSGGQPGSPGAGARTTGPHLHFEVWQDGMHVDPLLYLPLSAFLLESLPEPFQAQWLKEKVDSSSVIE